ncbi:MAG: outer membrane beta-barrel protein [Bacteroidota bacterium]|jgi:opacity protein-like surface antigen
MKKLFTVLVAIALIASLAFAGDDITPSAKSGATSLNFTFGGLGAFNLGEAGPSVPQPVAIPAGISISYFLNNNNAVRVGLQIQYGSETDPYQGTGSGTDGNRSEFGLGISGDYLMYIASSSRVRPYLGGGFLLTYSSNDVKYAAGPGATQQEIQNSQPAGVGFQLRGLAGAEFFIYNEMSISAEYQMNLFGIESFSDTKNTPGSTTKNGSQMQILGFQALAATVHIYF